jgi:hypothetical protein
MPSIPMIKPVAEADQQDPTKEAMAKVVLALKRMKSMLKLRKFLLKEEKELQPLRLKSKLEKKAQRLTKCILRGKELKRRKKRRKSRQRLWKIS